MTSAAQGTARCWSTLYFSNGGPAEEVTGAHSTLFRARKETHFYPTDGQRVRSVVGSFAPTGEHPHLPAEPMQWYFTTSRLAQLRWVCQRD
jgi:hypothetical protein